ncbi:MAG: carbohydrate kinase, partial [Myxococcales bacterium]
REVLESLASQGIDVSAVKKSGHATGSYTAILEPSGDLVVSVADMAATESLSPEDLTDLDAAWLVLDGNLMPPTVAAAIAEASGPVLLDPVGVAKAERLASVAHLPVHTFTPNQQELVAFTGIDDEAKAVAACRSRGMHNVWVRDGAKGSRLHTPDGVVEIAVIPGPVADVTGAGDSMLAAYAHRLNQGADVADAARYGAALAALTIASPHSVRPDLTDELVQHTLHQQEVR